MKTLPRKIITALAVVSVVLANALTSIFPLNNHTNADVSEQLRVHFVPAGYTFDVWWVIYLLLLGFAFFQFVAGKKYEEKLNKIFPWFILSCLLNFIWLALWHSQFFLPTIGIMIILSYCLYRINVVIQEGEEWVGPKPSLFLNTTFSVYFSWVAVSTFLNGVDVVWHVGIGGLVLAGQLWAVIMTIVLCLVGAYMLIKKRGHSFCCGYSLGTYRYMAEFPLCGCRKLYFTCCKCSAWDTSWCCSRSEDYSHTCSL